MQEEFSISNKTKIKIPRLPIRLLKSKILGEKYSLSVVFLSSKDSQKINKKFRKLDRPTNVLSFALNKNSGELILCPAVIKLEAKDENKNFGKNFRELLGFLVIHGMLHLKGWAHSSKMDEAEEFYSRKYVAQHFHRNRRGIIHDQSGGGRISKRRKKS